MRYVKQRLCQGHVSVTGFQHRPCWIWWCVLSLLLSDNPSSISRYASAFFTLVSYQVESLLSWYALLFDRFLWQPPCHCCYPRAAGAKFCWVVSVGPEYWVGPSAVVFFIHWCWHSLLYTLIIMPCVTSVLTWRLSLKPIVALILDKILKRRIFSRDIDDWVLVGKKRAKYFVLFLILLRLCNDGKLCNRKTIIWTANAFEEHVFPIMMLGT